MGDARRRAGLIYAEIDELVATLRYTNAGHNAPLLWRGRAEHSADEPVIERLDCGGTVPGLFSSAEYEEAELKLRSGDVLVACTDGVIEAYDAHDEEFGEERLAQILTANARLSAVEIERLILQAVSGLAALIRKTTRR